VPPDPNGPPVADAADAIGRIVRSCPGVADLAAAGVLSPTLSAVPGIRLDDDRVDVHVVVRYGTPVPRIVDQLSVALAPVLAGRTLHVHIDDIVMPDEQVPGPDQAAAAAGSGSPPGISQAR